MAFLSEPEPPRGVPIPAADHIARIVANNPSPMTYHGTNTWLVEAADGVSVIDPGPDDSAHVESILSAARGRISRILVTHSHHDHAGAVPALRAATGAPVFGWGGTFYAPDAVLADGEAAGDLIALHTPGHASDHLCFAGAGGVLFSGDHVMSWSTSIVSPPDGDMAAYMASLRRLLAREDQLYLCGHGPPLPNPQALVRAMLSHRVAREAAVLGALSVRPRATGDIVDQLYAGLDQNLVRAAERTVLAHLDKLRADGRAVCIDDLWVFAGG